MKLLIVRLYKKLMLFEKKDLLKRGLLKFIYDSFGSGNNTETITERTRTPPTIPNEIGEGIWNHGEISILNPIKAKIIAKP